MTIIAYFLSKDNDNEHHSHGKSEHDCPFFLFTHCSFSCLITLDYICHLICLLSFLCNKNISHIVSASLSHCTCFAICHITVCHITQFVTLQFVTKHSLSHFKVCHITEFVTLHNLSQHTVCHIILFFTLCSLSHYTACHIIQFFSLQSLSHYTVCHTTLSATHNDKCSLPHKALFHCVCHTVSHTLHQNRMLDELN